MRAVSADLSQASRSDARHNRARILAAAREVFALDGMAAPMRAVARRAGVAPATVYRHFPTKQALAVEAFTGRLTACHTLLETALADPDPWRALVGVVEGVLELHARDDDPTAALLAAFPHAVDLAALRARARESAVEVVRRAKQARTLRPDFAVDDLALIVMAGRGIRAATPAARIAASRRFAALAVHGLRPPRRPEPTATGRT